MKKCPQCNTELKNQNVEIIGLQTSERQDTVLVLGHCLKCNNKSTLVIHKFSKGELLEKDQHKYGRDRHQKTENRSEEKRHWVSDFNSNAYKRIFNQRSAVMRFIIALMAIVFIGCEKNLPDNDKPYVKCESYIDFDWIYEYYTGEEIEVTSVDFFTQEPTTELLPLDLYTMDEIIKEVNSMAPYCPEGYTNTCGVRGSGRLTLTCSKLLSHGETESDLTDLLPQK